MKALTATHTFLSARICWGWFIWRPRGFSIILLLFNLLFIVILFVVSRAEIVQSKASEVGEEQEECFWMKQLPACTHTLRQRVQSSCFIAPESTQVINKYKKKLNTECYFKESNILTSYWVDLSSSTQSERAEVLHSPLWTSPPEDKRIITQRKQMNTGKTRHQCQLCSDAFLKSRAQWILGNCLITQCCAAKAEVLSVWKKKIMRASSANHLWVSISSFGNYISMVQCPETVLKKSCSAASVEKSFYKLPWEILWAEFQSCLQTPPESALDKKCPNRWDWSTPAAPFPATNTNSKQMRNQLMLTTD